MSNFKILPPIKITRILERFKINTLFKIANFLERDLSEPLQFKNNHHDQSQLSVRHCIAKPPILEHFYLMNPSHSGCRLIDLKYSLC